MTNPDSKLESQDGLQQYNRWAVRAGVLGVTAVGAGLGFVGAEGYEAVSGEDLHTMAKVGYGIVGANISSLGCAIVAVERLIHKSRHENQ